MESAFDEDAGERAAAQEQEKSQLDEAWGILVLSVLSNVRVDPQQKGKALQGFLPFEGEVTAEHVTALRYSNYGTSFSHVISMLHELPKKDRPEIYDVAIWFRDLAIVTGSPHRSLTKIDADKKQLAALTDIAILRKVSFLERCRWGTDSSWFNLNGVGEVLNVYVDSKIDWDFINRTMLQMCVHFVAEAGRTALKESGKSFTLEMQAKSSIFGVLWVIARSLIRYAFPILLWLAIDGGILYWASQHYDGEHFSIWAIIGFLWVAITIPASIIHYGTMELRHGLNKLIYPGWDFVSPTINPDLDALDKAINDYNAGHVNLRLVRDQLIRLQRIPKLLPTQLLTLIDRSIAKGLHHW
jgi:hypothetical protein